MTWSELDADVADVFAEAARIRGPVRNGERQHYLESLPWTLRRETANLVTEEFGPESAALYAGPSWDDIEEYLWRAERLRKLAARERLRDRYSRQQERVERRRRRAEWRDNARGRVVGVRCCPICREMYVVTAYHRAYGKTNACSPAHRRLASGEKTGTWSLLPIGREKDTLEGLSRRNGLTSAAVRYRMRRLGWSLEQALTTPARAPSERRWKAGESMAARARAVGLNPQTARARKRLGMSDEEALLSKDAYRAKRNAGTLTARARAAGISWDTFRKRVDAGATVEEALARPPTPRADRKCGALRRDGLGPVGAAIVDAVRDGARTKAQIVARVFAAGATTSKASIATSTGKLVRAGRLVMSGVRWAPEYRLPSTSDALQIRGAA